MGPENSILHFDPYFPYKLLILGQILKKALTVAMLTYKLPSIIIIPHESCIVKKQIGVGESKYEVIGDPLLAGYVTQPNFGPKIGSKSTNKGLNNGDSHL